MYVRHLKKEGEEGGNRIRWGDEGEKRDVYRRMTNELVNDHVLLSELTKYKPTPLSPVFGSLNKEINQENRQHKTYRLQRTIPAAPGCTTHTSSSSSSVPPANGLIIAPSGTLQPCPKLADDGMYCDVNRKIRSGTLIE